MKKLDKNSAQDINSVGKKILTREVFETSRELEYFSEKELRAQIGHDTPFWPIAILRELIDNSLDACEKTGIAPIIDIEIKDDSLTVSDNGPGIPIKIINKSQDYLYRVSDKAYYIAPTRGQMGNALKVVYAAPFVVDPTNPGFVEIGSSGELHHISITMDRLAGKPVIKDKVSDFVRNGTFVKINSTSLLSLSNNDKYYKTAPTPQELIEGYTTFNPHVTFILNGTKYEATEPDWKKWLSDMPTSAHWYNTETISDLVAGYLVKERNNGQNKKTVREFVSEFRGLSGTAKQKKVTETYSRADLSMFEKDGDIDRETLKILLNRMQAECVAPKPTVLGVIGKEHFTKWMLNHGGAEPSITYIKKHGFDNGLPYFLEIGFAVKTDSTLHRTQITGLNWSPVIGEPPDASLRQAIQDAAIKPSDPVIFLAHIAKPRFEFIDRGKTKIELLSNLSIDISSAVKSATKKWKAEKRKADKDDNLYKHQYRTFYQYSDRVTIREVAFDVMEDAYNKASSNGKYYANARQIMYAARPEILKQTGRSELLSATFQTLLKDYIEEKNPSWKIAWDARGHIIEPHTNKRIGLGGIEVEEYMRGWGSSIPFDVPSVKSLIKTKGPENRFNNALFVEKEGFNEILSDAKFPERYDLALMSTKGLSNKAACDLIYKMDLLNVRVFVLHDFDVAGFKILRTLREGVRLSQGTDVIDLGLRMADIKELPSEPVNYKQRSYPGTYLKYDCGATEEEVDFLVNPGGGDYNGHFGNRVELNAMTSEQLIVWLEEKLKEYGVEKYIPDQDLLIKGYQRAKYLQLIQDKIDETIEENFAEYESQEISEDELKEITDDLNERLEEDPTLSWDEAIWDIVEENS